MCTIIFIESCSLLTDLIKDCVCFWQETVKDRFAYIFHLHAYNV